MDIVTIIVTIAGLCLFEAITSIDNAVINAEVLSTMGERAGRWFVTWGLLISVFLVRAALPWLIVWFSIPSLGPLGALTATFSSDPSVVQAVEQSAPLILTGGGMFLIFIFMHWLFLEEKEHAHWGEPFFESKGVWFFACVSVILALVVWLALRGNQMMAFSAVLGSTAFFIVHGFRQNAELQERNLMGGNILDTSKILYLEVIDATFSLDSVVGAFAFTLSVPLIVIGTGLGAVIVRHITVSGVEKITQYRFLKNGAMYSIAVLGLIMILDSFGIGIPVYVSPLVTFGIVGFFLYRSTQFGKGNGAA
ncbi:MAG TPA: DUF475 domain-containing protein [Methanoregulaceae archaeon]|nr:DUF475 domain-containing protein [Methanoregulaceae archaeon]